MKEKILQQPLFQVGASTIVLALGIQIISLLILSSTMLLEHFFAMKSSTTTMLRLTPPLVACLIFPPAILYLSKKWAISLKDFFLRQKTFKLVLIPFLVLFFIVYRMIDISLLYSLQHYLQELPLDKLNTLKVKTQEFDLIYYINIILSCLFIPILEEIFFRGLILKHLLKKCQPLQALLISALAFALYHLRLDDMFPLFIGGCVYALIYLKTNSLYLTILMHSITNLLALNIEHKAIPFAELSPSYIIMLSLSLLVVLIGLSLLFRRETVLSLKTKCLIFVSKLFREIWNIILD